MGSRLRQPIRHLTSNLALTVGVSTGLLLLAAAPTAARPGAGSLEGPALEGATVKGEFTSAYTATQPEGRGRVEDDLGDVDLAALLTDAARGPTRKLQGWWTWNTGAGGRGLCG